MSHIQITGTCTRIGFIFVTETGTRLVEIIRLAVWMIDNNVFIDCCEQWKMYDLSSVIVKNHNAIWCSVGIMQKS